jgi:hypothetical protein
MFQKKVTIKDIGMSLLALAGFCFSLYVCYWIFTYNVSRVRALFQLAQNGQYSILLFIIALPFIVGLVGLVNSTAWGWILEKTTSKKLG